MKLRFPLNPFKWGSTNNDMAYTSSMTYNGGTLSCSGINKSDNLNVALSKLDAKICESAGGVSSVALSSTDFSISGSPITSSGTITLNINNGAVTFAKMQNISTGVILGRYSNNSGVVQEISVGSGLLLSAGVLSATGSGSGSVTSITATAPLTGGTITTSGSIGITQATTSTNGYLSSTDWNTFSAKLSNITSLITAGTNITITGSGTSGSPYVINSTAGGSGASYDTMSTFICQPNSTIPSANNTYINFNGTAFSSTQNDKIFIIPNSGYIKNLFALVSGLQPASGTLSITLMSGSTIAGIANTALTLSVGAGVDSSTGTKYSNTSSSVAVSAGDILVVKCTNTATSTSAKIISISFLFTNS